MLRIGKLTDYSTVVMAYLAKQPEQAHKAKDIAQHTHLGLPTVSKLLKLLARAGLLAAQRGANGGYILSVPAHQITLAQIVHAIEGNIAITECSHGKGLCAVEPTCSIRGNWRTVNSILLDALQKISLAEMTKSPGLNIKLS